MLRVDGLRLNKSVVLFSVDSFLHYSQFHFPLPCQLELSSAHAIHLRSGEEVADSSSLSTWCRLNCSAQQHHRSSNCPAQTNPLDVELGCASSDQMRLDYGSTSILSSMSEKSWVVMIHRCYSRGRRLVYATYHQYYF